jgi:hypothetical protein
MREFGDPAYAILRIGTLTIVAHFLLLGLRWAKKLDRFPMEMLPAKRGRVHRSILIPGLTSSSILLSKGKGFPKTA